MFRFLQRILNTCLQKLRDLLGIGKQEEISHKIESRSNSAHSLTSKEIIVLPDDIEFISFETEPLPHHPSPEELLRQEIETARAILGSVDGKTLDDQQMRCVIDSSPRQLVIAGAGTGKTTTIIGKVMYLLKTKSVSPSEIAIFSYTNPSAREIRDRIQKATSSRIYAATFHSFAAKVIKEVEGYPQKITEGAAEEFIQKMFAPENLSEEIKQLLCKYALYGGDHLRSEVTFRSYSEYQDHLYRYLKTPLCGKAVPSFGSYFIANFLTIHGIDYSYYEKTDNFLIKGTNIFIQYHPFHANGYWPSCFNENYQTLVRQYRALEDKRHTYQRVNSIVIQCYSNQLYDGTLEGHLTKELSHYGLQPVLRPSEEIWASAFPSGGRELERTRETICNIISLMHSNNHSVEDVRCMVAGTEPKHNNQYICQLVEFLYPAYRQYLIENNLTTFDDLIIKTIDYLKRGKYKNPFKYIIVDEYQDIAPARVDLLKALIQSSPSDLLCVGDDWQSIYGFNGSNVRFILDFEKYWGPSTVNKIEKTYRFSQNLVDVLGDFVMTNPNQVKKRIRGHNNLNGSALRVLLADDSNQFLDLIAQTLDTFPINSTVFFIGRFKKDWGRITKDSIYFEQGSNGDISCCFRPDLRIKFLTAHASKGLEADNVIIINAKDEAFGFPSQIPTHPFVALLQGQAHQFPHDEERRLFYVAATRTRNRTFIVCERSNKSAFVNEIINKHPDVLDSNNHICPFCGAPLIEVEDLLCNTLVCKNFSDGTCNYMQDSVWIPPRKS